MATVPSIKGIVRVLKNLKPEDAFTEHISSIVERLKQFEANKEEYVKVNLHDRDIMVRAKKEGRLAGAKEKAIENAKNFLRMGCLTVEQIAQGVGLSVDEVLSLKNEV